jgi:hypothetical protein
VSSAKIMTKRHDVDRTKKDMPDARTVQATQGKRAQR